MVIALCVVSFVALYAVLNRYDYHLESADTAVRHDRWNNVLVVCTLDRKFGKVDGQEFNCGDD